MTIDFTSTPLLDQVIQYTNNPLEAFHMPGHAGGNSVHPKIKKFLGENVFKADLTELDELDNLSNPETFIKQTQEKIAGIFNTKRSYLLVNGSTLGLQASILACCKEKEKVLVARNCHRAVISAIILGGAEPVFFMPEWLSQWDLFGHINPETLDSALEYYQDISAVVITSPTYEGITSDTGTISAICKKYGTCLIVDEAHGGHFKYSERFPVSAVDATADAVIQSFHKSCGSLSQSSLLHIPQFSMIDTRLIEENLKLLQSTSPSYLLMASLDAASSFLYSDEGKQILDSTYNHSLTLRKKLQSIENLEVLENSSNYNLDPTRIFISIEGLSGESFADIIEEKYHIGIESLNRKGILLFLNIGNTESQHSRLIKALKEIAENTQPKNVTALKQPELPEFGISPREAYFSKSEAMPLQNALGRINRYPIVTCPPGVCTLLPGEIVKRNHFEYLSPETEIEVII